MLNGIQTQSAQVYDLSEALPEMGALGVDLVRLSPHSSHMNDVIEAFRLGTEGDVGALRSRLEAVRPSAAVDGYWHGKAGIDHAAA